MGRTTPTNEQAAANRRRHRRVEVAGIATVSEGKNKLTVWLVQDLSLGGTSLVGDSLLIPGQRLPLTLHLPGRPPFELLAHVLRRQLAARRGRTAIAFEAITPEQRRLIAEAIEAPAARPAAARVALLVVPSGTAVGPLLQELVTLGYEPRVTNGPLEAAAWLQKETAAEVVLADEKLIEIKGFNLLQLVRDTRPEIKRIVIGSSAHGFRTDVTLRTGLADSVVERPFAPGTLARRLTPSPAAARRRRAAG